MYKNLILYFHFFLILINFIYTESISDLIPYQLDDSNLEQNKNLKLKITLDSIRLKIGNSLYLECPVGRLQPVTFMFLRKDEVDFISRFSIQLKETYESIKKGKKNDLATFVTIKPGSENLSISKKRTKKNRMSLHCKWISSDFSQEYGNFTLLLNQPKDNVQLNNHLYKYFDLEDDHKRNVPKIITSANNVVKRMIGDKVSFFCKPDQPFVAKITWYRKDEHNLINLNDEMETNRHALDILNYRITSNRLTIKEIGEDDFAEYVCKASNNYGEDYAFYKLEMITKKFQELKIDSFEDLHLKENKSTFLNCTITSYEKFSVEWFEQINCKQECDNPHFFFIANDEKYRPLFSENSALVSHNKIQYLATYFLDKTHLVNGRKYICMVRNQNGMSYKIMKLTVNDKSTDDFIQFSDNNLTTVVVYLSSAATLILLITLIFIIVLMRKSKGINRDLENGNKSFNENLNNINTLSRGRSQNNYLNVPHRSKAFNEKSLKNSTFVINNLIQTGRATNLENNDYSSQYLNKSNRSKLDSISHSLQRLNNTPIPDDRLSHIGQSV